MARLGRAQSFAPIQLGVIDGTTTNTGSLSSTLDGVTLSAAGSLTIQGVFAKTLDDVTLASTGSVSIQGTLSKTLDDVTLSAQGSQGSIRTGELAVTLDSVTLSASGTLALNGALSVTLDGVTLSATGIGPDTSDTIDGAASYSINTAYGSVMLYHRGDRRFFTL